MVYMSAAGRNVVGLELGQILLMLLDVFVLLLQVWQIGTSVGWQRANYLHWFLLLYYTIHAPVLGSRIKKLEFGPAKILSFLIAS